jgi:hypothetical protein
LSFNLLERTRQIAVLGSGDNVPARWIALNCREHFWSPQIKHLRFDDLECVSNVCGWNGVVPSAYLMHYDPIDLEEFEAEDVSLIPGMTGMLPRSSLLVRSTLRSVTFGYNGKLTRGITSFAGSALTRCHTLQTLRLVGLVDLDTIGLECFSCCWQLQTVVLENLPKLRMIEDFAFSDLTNIDTFEFSDLPSLTSIGTGVLSRCTILDTVRFINVPSLITFGNEILSECARMIVIFTDNNAVIHRQFADFCPVRNIPTPPS